jgi:hypothetical protein
MYEAPFRDGLGEVNHGESGLFTADRTRVLEAVLNAHVTSFPPGAEGDDGFQNKLEIEPGCLEVATRSIRRFLL